MSNIEHRHLLGDVDSAFLNTQFHIESDMREPEAVLGVIADNIRNMFLLDFDISHVKAYLTDTTSYLRNDERLMAYSTGVYGFFDYFGGEMLFGYDFVMPHDFIAQEQPWYRTAVEANGRVGITEPYFNRILGITCITFARRVFDNEGNPFGIVCLDILLDRIKEYAVNTYVTMSSYGILFDSQFNVVAHPHSAYIGRNLVQLNDGQEMIDELLAGREIIERQTRDYNQNKSILFIRQLNNGWYLAIMAYTNRYFEGIRNIMIILIALGTALAAFLVSILLSTVSAKNKAEELARIMLDTVPVSTEIWDKNLNMIDCNQEAVKLYGLSSKE
jgi:hypothetical protein